MNTGDVISMGGETLEYLESICESCVHNEDCEYEWNPEECPYAYWG